MPRMAPGSRNWSDVPDGVLGELGERQVRRPSPPDGGQDDHERGEPEARDGQPQDGHAPRGVVAQGVGAHGGEDADGDGDEDGEGDGDDAEHERDGQATRQLLGHGALGPERLAEVAARDVAEPREVLDVDGPVEAELGPQVVDVLAVRLLLHHELDGVAGEQPGQREDDDGGDHQRRDRDEQALEEVSLHAGLRARGARPRASSFLSGRARPRSAGRPSRSPGSARSS